MKKLILALLLSWSAVASAPAQSGYPDRPVRLIVPASAGTVTDILARELAQILSPILKQPVIIENLIGAEQLIGTQAAVRAKPDGHTILFVSSSTTILDPVARASLPYDTTKDLAAGCAIGKTGNVLNMSSTLPFKTVNELIDAAKAAPEKYSFAYSSATTRMSGELFQQAAGIKLLGVPYKSSAGGLTDVAGGFVHLFFIDPASAAPHYASGKIKPMLVASRERFKTLPNVPTGIEMGLPGYEIWPSFGTWLPAGTPPHILSAAREALDKALKTSDFAAVLAKHGVEPFHACGDDLAKYTQDEIARWTEIFKKAGLAKQ